ncbi:hypothetical protein Taro_008029 [Colocasia esculenta]|uniref:Uncharacterized protein n=1 Tax=Colocasia esculenta TaxID=4460 RepID=A0A843U215_COLES|nr:hypothetical protein [Colocasia esculenta]
MPSQNTIWAVLGQQVDTSSDDGLHRSQQTKQRKMNDLVWMISCSPATKNFSTRSQQVLKLVPRNYVLVGKRDLILSRQMEGAILAQRDSLVGIDSRAEPIYRIGEPRLWAPILGVGNLEPNEDKLTRAPTFTPARWDNSSVQVNRENLAYGLFLAPLKWGYRDKPFVMDCLVIKFKHQMAAD